jgi:hypothetical protein
VSRGVGAIFLRYGGVDFAVIDIAYGDLGVHHGSARRIANSVGKGGTEFLRRAA